MTAPAIGTGFPNPCRGPRGSMEFCPNSPLPTPSSLFRKPWGGAVKYSISIFQFLLISILFQLSFQCFKPFNFHFNFHFNISISISISLKRFNKIEIGIEILKWKLKYWNENWNGNWNVWKIEMTIETKLKSAEIEILKCYIQPRHLNASLAVDPDGLR